jgi:hypothetical protein
MFDEGDLDRCYFLQKLEQVSDHLVIIDGDTKISTAQVGVPSRTSASDLPPARV